jgi:hypothetical protein
LNQNILVCDVKAIKTVVTQMRMQNLGNKFGFCTIYIR